MIVLIGSQKGGCGKSTIAVNVAAELARQGHDVVLVDSDRQSTAANWALDREDHVDLPRVHCVQRYENISSTLIDLAGRYKYVVVDAAGRDSRELRTGMAAANLMVVPFRPSQPDLDTLPHLDEVVTQAKDLNPELTVRALLTMVPTNPQIREVQQSLEYLNDYPAIAPLTSLVRDRKVYRDAIAEGRGVGEMKNPKAREEMHRLMKELF